MVRSSNSDERVLVTGGNGAVGHFVIEQLTAMGIEIIVLSRSKFQSADPMVTPLAADIRDLDSIQSAIGRPYTGYYRPIARKAAALVHSLCITMDLLMAISAQPFT